MKLIAILFASSIFIIPAISLAEVAKWQIVPNENPVQFTAMQNNAPVKGSFKTVTGDIAFSPTDLKDCKVDIAIDMKSVNTSYKELIDILKMDDWLNVAKFPEAHFTSDKILEVKENAYLATGVLQVRDKKIPLDIGFTVKDPAKDHMQVIGETTIKRTALGIGQGDWASTDEIKDDVKVTFDLILKPQ